MKLASAIVIAAALSIPAFGQVATPAAAPPAAPAVPPKAKAPFYDENADVKQLIAAATAKAKKENRRVLVQWGGNWCGWCIRLHELTKSNKDIARTLQYEYDVVYADSGRNGKNMELIEAYDAKAKEQGFPYLTVLDGDGKVIANQDSGSLEVRDPATNITSLEAGHDPALVLAFLKRHVTTPWNADEVMAKGLAEAKSSGRTAFVHFGAPWCGWCHRLEDWMAKPEIAKVLAKDFVDVKIDIDRTIGGKELLAKYRVGPDSGIPWFVFLDGNGKAITDSTGPKGNTGFPAAPEEIEHFATMLGKARKKLSDADVKGLVESLKAESKQTGH